jgi:hypothetical protein
MSSMITSTAPLSLVNINIDPNTLGMQSADVRLTGNKGPLLHVKEGANGNCVH